MSWLFTALKFIPWRDVVQNAPTVLRTAKRLWDKEQPQPSVQQELASLREEARRAAEVIASLAEQNARLVEAVEVLRARTRLLMYVLGAVSVGLVAVIVFLLVR